MPNFISKLLATALTLSFCTASFSDTTADKEIKASEAVISFTTEEINALRAQALSSIEPTPSTLTLLKVNSLEQSIERLTMPELLLVMLDYKAGYWTPKMQDLLWKKMDDLSETHAKNFPVFIDGLRWLLQFDHALVESQEESQALGRVVWTPALTALNEEHDNSDRIEPALQTASRLSSIFTPEELKSFETANANAKSNISAALSRLKKYRYSEPETVPTTQSLIDIPVVVTVPDLMRETRGYADEPFQALAIRQSLLEFDAVLTVNAQELSSEKDQLDKGCAAVSTQLPVVCTDEQVTWEGLTGRLLMENALSKDVLKATGIVAVLPETSTVLAVASAVEGGITPSLEMALSFAKLAPAKTTAVPREEFTLLVDNLLSANPGNVEDLEQRIRTRIQEVSQEKGDAAAKLIREHLNAAHAQLKFDAALAASMRQSFDAKTVTMTPELTQLVAQRPQEQRAHTEELLSTAAALANKANAYGQAGVMLADSYYLKALDGVARLERVLLKATP